MRRLFVPLLAALLVLPATSLSASAADDTLVVYTAYEENELKTFWDQFKKDLPSGQAGALERKKPVTLAWAPDDAIVIATTGLSTD